MKPISDNNPPIYVKDTGTQKGRGVFAASAIHRDEIIETCPVIKLNTPLVQFPDELQGIVFHGDIFAKKPGISALVLGSGSLYNHANPANARYKPSPDGEYLIISAVRPIEADEEITINYNAATGETVPNENDWFSEREITLFEAPVSYLNSVLAK